MAKADPLSSVLEQVEGTLSRDQYNTALAVIVFVMGASIICAVMATELMVRAAAVSIVLTMAITYSRVTRMRFTVLHQSLADATRNHSEVVELAERDALTGLPNRVAFNQALSQYEEQEAHSRISLLFFDLNRFKDVNDSLGHNVGDILLREVADRLRPIFTEQQLLARIGGDEFAAIIPIDCPTTIKEWGRKIHDALTIPFDIEGHEIVIGTSMGAAIGDVKVDGGEELLRRADLAMYEAKSQQSSDIRLFDSRLSQKLSERRVVRVEMPGALLDNQISLAYQPIVDARTGKLQSAEALMRWASPVLGHVSPALAVPVAEESGQIVALTDLTLREALRVASRLDSCRVGVNISPVAFRQNGFVDAVASHLIDAGLGSDRLYLEITEGVLISHMDQANRTVKQLRDLGIEVYLDDFGTGYSSLSYLQHFEMDGLKIDKSFLRHLGRREQATQIMRSVINLGHSLNMTVVAEGVENEWQARLLQLLTCDRLQGYYFAAPMNADDFMAYALANAAQPIVQETADEDESDEPPAAAVNS